MTPELIRLHCAITQAEASRFPHFADGLRRVLSGMIGPEPVSAPSPGEKSPGTGLETPVCPVSA